MRRHELLFGLTHSLPYNKDEKGFYHYKKVKQKDAIFRMVENKRISRKEWQVQDAKNGKFDSVATVNPKRFDVETRLIINLLDYFKNEPAKRPTHTHLLLKGEGMNVVILLKKRTNA